MMDGIRRREKKDQGKKYFVFQIERRERERRKKGTGIKVVGGIGGNGIGDGGEERRRMADTQIRWMGSICTVTTG